MILLAVDSPNKHAGKVHAARERILARLDRARHGLARDGTGVEARSTLDHSSVEGDLLARLYQDDLPNLHRIGVDDDHLTVAFDVCGIGADVQKLLD